MPPEAPPSCALALRRGGAAQTCCCSPLCVLGAQRSKGNGARGRLGAYFHSRHMTAMSATFRAVLPRQGCPSSAAFFFCRMGAQESANEGEDEQDSARVQRPIRVCLCMCAR
jgi:hypothetical protein